MRLPLKYHLLDAEHNGIAFIACGKRGLVEYRSRGGKVEGRIEGGVGAGFRAIIPENFDATAYLMEHGCGRCRSILAARRRNAGCD